MSTLSKEDRERWFKHRHRKYRSEYRSFAKEILELLSFTTVFDLGCATGLLMEPFIEAGKEVLGVEKDPVARDCTSLELQQKILYQDFAEAPLSGPFDLVVCIEVAEHIEPFRSVELVDALCSRIGSYLLFSAAPPGQPGVGHINCRPHREWLHWFSARRVHECLEETKQIRGHLQSFKRATWLQHNTFVLRKDGSGII